MFQSVLLDFFKNLSIRIRSCYLLLNIGGIKLAFVLDLIKQFGTTFRIDDPDLLTFIKEDAIHSYI